MSPISKRACPKCGRVLSKEAHFCIGCGAELPPWEEAEDAGIDPASTAVASPASPQPLPAEVPTGASETGAADHDPAASGMVAYYDRYAGGGWAPSPPLLTPFSAPMASQQRTDPFDVFISYSHSYVKWVEELASRLSDEHDFHVWLDRWVLVPGSQWQRAMVTGLRQASTCAVCLGKDTPRGWFLQEIQKALDLQTQNDDYRVIPVLLPDAPSDLSEVMPPFLELRTWVDFRDEQDGEFAFHVLVQGIRGEPVGRWRTRAASAAAESIGPASIADELRELAQYQPYLHESVLIEFQQKILSRRFGAK